MGDNRINRCVIVVPRLLGHTVLSSFYELEREETLRLVWHRKSQAVSRLEGSRGGSETD